MDRYVRKARKLKEGEWFTAKRLLMILALIATVGSAIYWWGIQKELTPNVMVALAYTAIMVLAPPSLVSFMIPWSPAGMLMQKINARTWGYGVVCGAALILCYYSFVLQYQWWSAQEGAILNDIVLRQVLIGMIGTIFIPALLWSPVSSDELIEKVRQAHLVGRYELQTQADLTILRNTLMRAQEKALIGFNNLTVQEREELAAVMHGLVRGIDQTMKELAHSVKTVSGATVPYGSLEEKDDIKGYLEYITESLVESGSLPSSQRPLTSPAGTLEQPSGQGQPPQSNRRGGVSRDE